MGESAAQSSGYRAGRKFNVAIAGASGSVGKELVDCMKKREFPLGDLFLFAGSSAGKVQKTPYGDITLEAWNFDKARACDVVFLAVGGDFSREWAPKLIEPCDGKAVPVVIDNSSAFRLQKNVPLVIPEINMSVMHDCDGLIANPNCTTAIAAMALWPLHQKYGLERVIVSTYQAASGAGIKGPRELCEGAKLFIADEENAQHFGKVDNLPATTFVHPLAFNLIPHIDTFQENGYTREEMKVTWEMRKIFGDPGPRLICFAGSLFFHFVVNLLSYVVPNLTLLSDRVLSDRVPWSLKELEKWRTK